MSVTKRRLIELSFWVRFKSEINTRRVLSNLEVCVHVAFETGSNPGSANRNFSMREFQVIYLTNEIQAIHLQPYRTRQDFVCPETDDSSDCLTLQPFGQSDI